ncbi:unnamed protein product [Closterium sp. NIES-54]
MSACRAPARTFAIAAVAILVLLFPNDPSDPLSLTPLTAQAASSKPWMGVNLGVGLSSNPVSLTPAVSIIKQRGFSAVKLFQPDPTALNALAGSGLQVMTCVPNERIGEIAKSDSAALAWLDANIMPFMAKTNILAIAVGNEVLSPGNPFLRSVVPAMESLYRALTARKLHRRVKLVTPQHMSFLQDTYPPSSAQVMSSVRGEVTSLLSFLNRTGSYAVLNAYPFFSYLGDPANIPRDFVFFKGGAGSYDDKGRRYGNMMEASIDAALWSFEKLGFPNMPFIVGETGWPTAGAAIASPSAAKEWNTGLVSFLLSGRGTPKRRNSPIRAYLFEMFDEDRKDTTMGAFEASWGLCTMQGDPKYSLNVLGGGGNGSSGGSSKSGGGGGSSSGSGGSSSGGNGGTSPRWCIPKSSATKQALSNAVAWACSSGGGGMNCGTLMAKCPESSKATVVFNEWYQQERQHPAACDFAGGVGSWGAKFGGAGSGGSRVVLWRGRSGRGAGATRARGTGVAGGGGACAGGTGAGGNGGAGAGGPGAGGAGGAGAGGTGARGNRAGGGGDAGTRGTSAGSDGAGGTGAAGARGAGEGGPEVGDAGGTVAGGSGTVGTVKKQE